MKCSSSYNLRETRWKCRIIVYVPVKTKKKTIQILKHREGRENEKARNTSESISDGEAPSLVLCGKTGDRFELGEQ